MPETIRQIHRESDETYGMPRLRAELQAVGYRISRKVVGWCMGERMTAELVIVALKMALHTRRPESVIHRSDQGSQYTSVAFGSRCQEMGARPSMGAVGDAYDSAMAESFFATLECELLNRRSWESKAEARTALFTWFEGWYNPRPRHSALGYLSPIAFEEKHVVQIYNLMTA